MSMIDDEIIISYFLGKAFFQGDYPSEEYLVLFGYLIYLNFFEEMLPLSQFNLELPFMSFTNEMIVSHLF